MHDLGGILATALQLIINLQPELVEIVILSLQVSITAVLIATLISIPLGTLLGTYRFPGHSLICGTLNTLMGLPPVVVGLGLYLFLSRSGPLGDLNLLFTSSAMIIAQCILVTPIIASLTQQTVNDLFQQHQEQFKALGAPISSTLLPLAWDARNSLLTAILAGFGRASAEVGAVLIVGGNINHVTRVMTTTIALETSKGNLELAMALGIILLAISFSITSLMMLVRQHK
ncbi:MAG: ABC transporter permease subunit [Candidatus Thioglobus sp.]|nr:MAG: ABC transporter permease subunit [Candidatus Thioglobus sp.]|tara:strand:+ start:3354 stop:4043 length:690 start_codon:yes stop_codon:yes gene_type:complete